MDLLSPAFLFGLIEFAAILSVAVAGIVRLRGHRSRMDRAAVTVASAAPLSVYPPRCGEGAGGSEAAVKAGPASGCTTDGQAAAKRRRVVSRPARLRSRSPDRLQRGGPTGGR